MIRYKAKASDIIHCFGDYAVINSQLIVNCGEIEIQGVSPEPEPTEWVKPAGVLWAAPLRADDMEIRVRALELMDRVAFEAALVTETHRVGKVVDKIWVSLSGGRLLLPRKYRACLAKDYAIGEAIIGGSPIGIIFGARYEVVGAVVAKSPE